MNNFLWGSASASYQCEGAWKEDGKIESMWDHYLHENNLENGDVASDHYHRYEEDIRRMRDGGQNAYRFSISWCRILDEKNEINQKGIEFYRSLIRCCKENGLEPFVTLYHWDLPQYLEEKGGWLNKDTVYAYEYFSKVVFEAFCGEVKYWTTFNEPRWFIFNGYWIGNYPPGKKDKQLTTLGAYHVMLANALAIRAFKTMHIPGQIGIVHSYTPIDGVDDSPACLEAMRFADNYCNNWVLDTAALGEIPEDMLEKLASEGVDLSFILEEDKKIMRENTVDFLGLNYYARALVKPYTSGETELIVNNTGKKGKGTSKTIIKNWFEQVMDPNSEYTEWDTEIYPKGLQEGLVRAHKKYGVPLFVTENGLGFYEDVSKGEVNDVYRISFLNDHINAILNAMDMGVDVRGYFVWSPFDLYSWKNGCEKRYGLVAIDFENNLRRTPKKSYFWYKEVCESNGQSIYRKKL